MNGRTALYSLALAGGLFLFAACGPRGDAGSPRREPAKPETPPRAKEAPVPAGSPTAAPAGAVPVPPAAARPPEAAPPVRPYAAKDDPLFAAPGNFVGPEDFTLGELQGGREGDPRIREADGLFRNFFADLREGRSPSGRIHPDYRSFLLRRLEDFAGRKEAPTEVRIGRIHLSDRNPEAAQAKVLLIGEKGRARGEIAAEKHDGAWYVSGLFIDFADLERPREPPAGAFDPGSASGPF